MQQLFPSLGFLAWAQTAQGGDPEVAIDAYQKACQFTSTGNLILTGGTDGERVKGWSVPEMRFMSSIMRDKEGFVMGAEVLDIATTLHLVHNTSTCLPLYIVDCGSTRGLDRVLG